MGTVIGFVALSAFAAFMVRFGYRFAMDKLSREQTAINIQRDTLRAEWFALEQARRVNDVFYQARTALHNEATGQTSRPPWGGNQS